MAHFPPQKNPPWVRNNAVQQQQQQQPLLAQAQMTVQSVALSQPTLTATTHHLAAGQNQIGQVQITPAIQGQVQLPLTQAHLLLNHQQLAPAFGQVQINQAQLANIATSQHQAAAHHHHHQTYFTPAISLHQQNVGIPQGTIQIQPSSLVIPTTISTSIAPPGLAMPTTLATVPNTTGSYPMNRLSSAPSSIQQPTVKQRVFTGTVTKLHENFGFVDDDVIFQASSVKGAIPQVGDRVLVEASYNGSMPFKWSAQRVQVIAPQAQKHLSSFSSSNDTGKQSQQHRDWALRSRSSDYRDSTPKSREPRTRRSSRSASRSPSRKRSRSPPSSPRRRSRTTPRYSVQIPKVSLDCREANVVELRRRYSHLYIPSDFMNTTYSWVESFPAHRPLPLDKPVSFHIFDKDVDPPEENTAIYEPPDADYAYSAKVMLLSLPSMEEMQRRCCSDGDDGDFVHPARLIRFLVGHRSGKNETMAIGGPWSPSLDGPDPKMDAQVLIRTAIRTCKALTGVDLSSCTQWYRMAEIRYQRVSSTKSRTESVVLFLPDVWSCVPTSSQWESIVQGYVPCPTEDSSPTAEDGQAEMEKADDVLAEEEQQEPTEMRKEATHHSLLDPRNLKIGELRAELDARNLSSKGFRSQLIPRLIIALKAEAADEEEKKKRSKSEDDSETRVPASSAEANDPPSRGESPAIVQVAPGAEDLRGMDFAAMPQILVHPSRTAKGGKFGCSLVNLSVLLDYRLEDTKEHTFEVSLFSELFNEMLMRDFGMLVYRSVASESLKKDKKERKPTRANHFSPAQLLLAYCYFDLSHCNYIASKDLEDLFLTLGLQLSRAQIRRLLQKVVTDDSLRYKKLIEKFAGKEEEDGGREEEVPLDEVSELTDKEPSVSNEPAPAPSGSFVNVDKLLLRLDQSEACRRQTESQFKSAQNQLTECRAELTKATDTIATLCQQLESARQQADLTNSELRQLQESFAQYVEGVNKIQFITTSLLHQGSSAEGKEEKTMEEPEIDQ